MVDIEHDALVTSVRRLHDAHDNDVPRMLGDTIGACVDLFAVIGSGLTIIDEQQSLRDIASNDEPDASWSACSPRPARAPARASVGAHCSRLAFAAGSMGLERRCLAITGGREQ
jgi:hypothetical protein